MTVLMRACPRCGDGDIEVTSEWQVRAERCVQCGYRRDTPVPVTSARPYHPERHGNGRRALGRMREGDNARRLAGEGP